jgi:hypothetical protein
MPQRLQQPTLEFVGRGGPDRTTLRAPCRRGFARGTTGTLDRLRHDALGQAEDLTRALDEEMAADGVLDAGEQRDHHLQRALPGVAPGEGAQHVTVHELHGVVGGIPHSTPSVGPRATHQRIRVVPCGRSTTTTSSPSASSTPSERIMAFWPAASPSNVSATPRTIRRSVRA